MTRKEKIEKIAELESSIEPFKEKRKEDFKKVKEMFNSDTDKIIALINSRIENIKGQIK